MTITDIAIICHEANRALCFTQRDFSQLPWMEAPDWQKQSAIEGVQFNLDNPDAPASALHENWVKEKIAKGWKWGKEKDAGLKTHPCLVLFGDLPSEQRAKDYLFKAIVNSMAKFLKD